MGCTVLNPFHVALVRPRPPALRPPQRSLVAPPSTSLQAIPLAGGWGWGGWSITSPPPITSIFPSGRTVCGLPKVKPIGRTDSKSVQASRAGWRRLRRCPGERADIPRHQEGEAGGEGRGEEGASDRMSRIPGFSGRFYTCSKASQGAPDTGRKLGFTHPQGTDTPSTW